MPPPAVTTPAAPPLAAARRIECACCGHALAVPDGLPERAAFTCGHCGLILRNVEAARAFRWAQVDPYVRKHGASRANLWGGLLGATAWVPVLAGVMLWQGSFDASLLAAVAGPYLLLLALLRGLRPHRPAMLWAFWLWAGLGAFLLYMAALVHLFPDWAGVLLDASVPSLPFATLVTLGAVWLLIGAVGALSYRRKARRLPIAHGTPPSA